MADIESFVKPIRLYRYRSLENGKLEREIEAIRGRYLFCSPYAELNDPMEGSFESSKILRDSAQYDQIKASITDRKAEIGMCSFSEVENHELMWAHYADQFKGICVSYHLSRLLRHMNDRIQFVRMFYSEKVPRVASGRKPPEEIAKMILSYKNYRWLYEREWRMFANRGRAGYGEHSCIARIYLGSRIDQGHRQRILDDLCPLGIKVSDMSVAKYTISFTAANAAAG